MENIAFCYYYEYNGIIYYSMPSYDISYSKYSPGTILLNYLIKKSFDNPNIFEFNFMKVFMIISYGGNLVVNIM